MEIFGDIERFASDLYPYRWPIVIGAALAAVAALAVAIRLRWHESMWRHRLLTAAIAVPLIAVMAPIAVYTISPLFERSRLEEASPLAAGASGVPSPSPAAAFSETPSADASAVPSPAPSASAESPTAAIPATPAFVAGVRFQGQIDGADDFHFGRGTAQIIETAPGRYTLRFEVFSVRNGPDLFVYLTPATDGDSVDGAINLGELKATDGAFNYEIPEGTDIGAYRSAIVWCRQFATLFASAPLAPI